MKDIVTLAIPANALLRLLQFSSTQAGAASASELAAVAIDEWLNRAQPAATPIARRRGYQWKTIFLPEGTQLRACSRSGCAAYAEVIGDAIFHEGEPVSPHQFICRCKGISRSAWTEITLLFPDADIWKTADACRQDALRRPQPPVPAPPPPAAGGANPAPPQPTPSAAPARLPRIPPIPTQARRLAARPPSPCMALEEVWAAAKDRRRGYRRAEDLLLE